MAIGLSIYKNIAIINFKFIGDTLCALPLIKYCRVQAPQAKITVLLGKENAVLAQWIGNGTETIVLPVTNDKRRRYLPLIKFILAYRKKFDLIIFSNKPRRYVNIFMYFLKAKATIAYVKDTWDARLISHSRLYDPVVQRTRHNALKMLNVVADYQELPEELRPQIAIPTAIKQQYLPQILAKLGDKISLPRLFISVTNNREECTINLNLYRDLFTELKKQFNFSVVISYLPQDQKRAEELVNLLPVPAVAIATPSFAEFMVLLDLVNGCFLGDGGIAHLAAALDKPQVVLFGAILPIEWLPLSKKVQYLYHSENVNYINRQEIMVKLQDLLSQMRVTS